MRRSPFRLLVSAGGLALAAVVLAQERQRPPDREPIDRGAVTGATPARGYDHPDQFLHLEPVEVAGNMEPVVRHAAQDDQARAKLDALQARTGRRPNVLIFLVDDVGWWDPGFNGGGVAVGNPTPNLDRYASRGLVLTSAYSTPSCTPTRATIMTGQNPLHHGLQRPPMYGEPGGLEGMTTLAQLMKAQGYTTQAVGKWHLGENEGSQPHSVGFDGFYGFLGVSDMYTEWRDVYFNPEIALSPSRFRMLEETQFNHHNVRCTPERGLEEVYEIDLQTIQDLDQDWARESEEFVRGQEGADAPWFLYHCTRAAHFDNYPNAEFAGSSPARTSYSDAIVEIDAIFGRLMRALEETGQAGSTLVVFASDNGPEAEVPPHGRTPFRGDKGSSWEGGVRVPTFAYWEGVIQPRRSDGLFDYADLFNTCLSLAGEPGAAVGELVPEGHYVDGIDQASFLLADDGQSNRRSRIYTLNQHLAGVRMDEFKLLTAVELQGAIFDRGHTGGFSGPIESDLGGAVMVNLYTDPREDVAVGIRHLPLAVPLMAELERYADVLERFPPRTTVGMPGTK